MKKGGLIGRKSQVAIFLITAAAIVLAGLLYFIYSKQLSEAPIEPVAEEVVPVKKFVEECIKESVEEGFARISLSGGYIEPPENTLRNPGYHLSPGKLGYKMPYWYHDGVLDIPTEPLIKTQLKNFVREQTLLCLDGFGIFKGVYDITEVGDFESEVEFNENDVSLKAKYPIEVVLENGNFKALVSDFAYTHPIRFKKAYDLARLIMERQHKDHFLEARTIDLISMDKSIPTTDIEATCKEKRWSLFDIRNRISELLGANIKYLRVGGTDFSPGLYVPIPGEDDVYSQSYYQHHYILDVADKPDFRNLKVSFQYDDFPLYINARPSQGGILKSNAQRGQKMLSFLCLQIWHFTYDISYPVIVSVIDKETDKNREFRFNFAFMVEIDHNQATRENLGTSAFEINPDISSEEFCDEAENEVTILTADNITGEPIKDVQLTYSCGRYYCDMGKSDWISLGAAAGVTRKMPFCFNAVIRGTKDDYSEGYTFAQTDSEGNSYLLFLNPLKTITNFRVVKHSISSPAVETELLPGEKATISLKEINGSYEAFTSYPLDSEFALQIPIKTAKYEVTIYVANNETFVGGYIGKLDIDLGIADANEIIFHTISQELKTEEEAFLFISSLEANSKKVPMPQIK